MSSVFVKYKNIITHIHSKQLELYAQVWHKINPARSPMHGGGVHDVALLSEKLFSVEVH